MATVARTPIDPRLIESWIEIRPDNTIAVRTGVADFGQGSVGTVFRQIVAEELRVRFEVVAELVTGDTDRTPDGGLAAGSMNRITHEHYQAAGGLHPDSPFGRSALNLQKVAAYAYGALMDRAARVLGVALETLTATDGVVRSGSGSVTYAELVRDSPLDVQLEVAGVADGFGLVVLGTPPLVPVSQWRVLGTSCPSPRIPHIVRGESEDLGDVMLPGMLHGRMVHPRTLGSTLVELGHLDADEYPGAQILVEGNLVGVVSEDEWEAARASQSLAETTVWSDWHGLPASDRLVEAMLEIDWSKVPTKASAPDGDRVQAVLAGAPRKLNEFFALPFYKHAPMSPEVVVADAGSDGRTAIWASTQQFHGLRRKIATMLETDPENVVVHSAPGAGGFGRTTGGRRRSRSGGSHPVASVRAAGPAAVDAGGGFRLVDATRALSRRGIGGARRDRANGLVHGRAPHARHQQRRSPARGAPGRLAQRSAPIAGCVPEQHMGRVAVRSRRQPGRACARRREHRASRVAIARRAAPPEHAKPGAPATELCRRVDGERGRGGRRRRPDSIPDRPHDGQPPH
jgi:hypothetical protein